MEEGHDIRNVKLGSDALTGENCAALCKDDDDCKFWTLSFFSKSCGLKTSDAGRQLNDKYISGFKPCN